MAVGRSRDSFGTLRHHGYDCSRIPRDDNHRDDAHHGHNKLEVHGDNYCRDGEDHPSGHSRRVHHPRVCYPCTAQEWVDEV